MGKMIALNAVGFRHANYPRINDLIALFNSPASVAPTTMYTHGV